MARTRRYSRPSAQYRCEHYGPTGYELFTAAGIRQVRVHYARHTAATLLLAQGVDQRVVIEILGHSQISMTAATPTSSRP